MSTACRICGNSQGNTAYQAREMMFGLGDTFDYFQCPQCECLQIREFPQDMTRYYPEGYYSLSTNDSLFRRCVKVPLKRLRDQYIFSARGLPGKLLSLLVPNPTLQVLKRIPLKKESRILDVGSGRGFILESLKNAGFKNVLGIDPYLKQDLQYDGVTIFKRSLKNIEGAWDLIMFHHSFEHLPDPLEILKTTHKLLTKEGLCLIRIPIVSSYAWEHYKTSWAQLDAPRHFFLHSTKSLELLAAKTGFKIEDIIYDSTEFQFWASEQYKKGIPLQSGCSFSLWKLRSLRRQAEELNRQRQGDQAAFYLRKQ